MPNITTRGNAGRFTTVDAAIAAPYPGPLKVGDRGGAVTAVQGALHAWGAHRLKTHPHEELIRKGGSTGDFGQPTALQCGHAQAVFRLPVTNSFGPGLHNHLARWYTDAGRDLLVELEHHRKVAAFHQILTQWAVAIAGNRDDWQYTQGSTRMDLLNRGGDPSKQRYVHGDCSSTAGALIRLACRWVGLPEPGFGDWFTTFSLISHGRTVSTVGLVCGDRVHYGANTHVGLYIGHPLVPVLSFGGEPGPESRRTLYRPVYACRRDVE